MIDKSAHALSGKYLFQFTVDLLRDEIHIKNSITSASNLLEGIANKEANNLGGTLSESLDLCKDIFPHESVKNSIKNMYNFFNDYPNLRHAGNPSSKKRDLKNDDALLVIFLAITFGRYIFLNNGSRIILNGEIEEYNRERETALVMNYLFQ